jgi:hypothetical protein
MILFHPSSLGTIMTNSKDQSEVIGETCKKHLIEVFISEQYGRRKTLENKWLKKGIAVENESIGLFNSLHSKKYVKNTETIKNDFIIGTPDIIEDIIGEAKSSYDVWTFLNAKHSKLDKDYYWQVQGYMWLTGLKSAKLFYALCNSPVDEILEEKRRLAWKLKSIDEETDEYIERCQQIERNAIYDIELFKYDNPYFDFHSNVEEWTYDIPKAQRLHVVNIPYDLEAIDKLKRRIEDCRKWMEDNLFNVPERIDIEGV